MNNNGIFTVLLYSSVLFANLLQADALRLSEAYEKALKNESQTKSIMYKAEAMDNYVLQSIARMLPQVSLSASTAKYEYQVNYYKTGTEEIYRTYGININQAVFRPELWNSYFQAKARRDGTYSQAQKQSQTLGLDLAKVYFELARSQRNLEITKAQKDSYEAKYKQIEKMLSMGLSNRIDLLETKSRLNKAKTEWLTEQKKVKVAKIALGNMIGEPIDEIAIMDVSKIAPEKLVLNKEEWEAKIDKSPEIKVSRAQQKMAKYELLARKFEFAPKVDLGASFSKNYTNDPVAHKYDNKVVLQLSIPIFEGGYTYARIGEAKLLLNAASEDLSYTEKKTKEKFENLWAEREMTIDTIQVLIDSEGSAELAVAYTEKAAKVGLKSLVDVFDAKSKLFTVKRDMIDAIYQLTVNQMGLLDVAGELTSDRIKEFEELISGSKTNLHAASF